jgi:hypothetical protein
MARKMREKTNSPRFWTPTVQEFVKKIACSGKTVF